MSRFHGLAFLALALAQSCALTDPPLHVTLEPAPTPFAHCASRHQWRSGPTSSLTHVAHTYAAGPTSCRPTQPDLCHADHAAGPTSRRPRSRTYVAQTHAVGPTPLRLTQPDTKAGSCASCSPAPRRRSHDETKAGSFSSGSPVPPDDVKAGSCDPCSPAPRRDKGREWRFVLFRAPTPRCMRPQMYPAVDAAADHDLSFARLVNAPAGPEAMTLDGLRHPYGLRFDLPFTTPSIRPISAVNTYMFRCSVNSDHAGLPLCPAFPEPSRALMPTSFLTYTAVFNSNR
ncbi:hypothetical protein B0H13DRAFT_2299998 [Mycena leptocephala]|nr:hypothetical protein B0H13DRAFT_2299998 [Mycena leptocephala]